MSARQRDESRLCEVEGRLEEMRRERDALQDRLEELASRRDRSAMEQRLRKRVAELEGEAQCLRSSVAAQRELREAKEKENADQVAALTNRLRLTDARHRGLQQHLQQLKESYLECFGDSPPTKNSA